MFGRAFSSTLPLPCWQYVQLSIGRYIGPAEKRRHVIIEEHFEAWSISVCLLIRVLILFVFGEVNLLEGFVTEESHFSLLSIAILPELGRAIVTHANDVVEFGIDSDTLNKLSVLFKDTLVTALLHKPHDNAFIHSR